MISLRKSIHLLVTALLSLLVIISGCRSDGEKMPEPEKPTALLIYSKTKGYRHECIEPGSAALKAYFSPRNIETTITEDSSLFTKAKLKDYDVVMFFQTTGNVLDSTQEIALQSFVSSGKGFVGVHAASDTEYEWPWYTGLVGAQFAGHPDIQQAVVQKTDTAHQSCKHLPERWTRTDEWYNFRSIPDSVRVLLTVDEATYQGGTHGSDHPLSWCHEYDGGRSFYTAMGHTVESYQDSLFLEHIYQGVKWTLKTKK